MINEKYAKKYCSEYLSLIENYDIAVADMNQTWDCHHRGEILPCGRFSINDLKKFGLYYKRPASELIFLTHSEHRQLHLKGVPKPYLKGIPRSEATKKAIGDGLKGHSVSEATKKAISEANSKKIQQFTKSGEFIRKWQSAMEASRRLGIVQQNICSCCNKKLKSAGGYVWKYV